MNDMSLHTTRARRLRPRNLVRQGFTLIEILVALAIFSVLLTVIMIPLSNGVTLTQIGSARADTQQAAQTTMNRIVSELRRASFVFPNERTPGITDRGSYLNNSGFPYFRTLSGADGACGSPQGFSNTSRLDMLIPFSDRDNPNATVANQSPISIVTFYSARADVSLEWNASNPPRPVFEADRNPVVMYRSQIPFQRKNNTPFDVAASPTQLNALIDDERFPNGAQCTSNAVYYNRGTRWLMHNGAGEPELVRVKDPANPTQEHPSNPALKEDITSAVTPIPAYNNPQTEPASNNRVTPLGVGMYAPRANVEDNVGFPANETGGKMFTPSTSFICEDTNANGIIDRVTVTLVMGKYDSGNSESRAQNVRLVQTVDLPNVESRFSSPR